MRSYVTRRVLWLVLVLLGVSVLTFALGAIAPGDPAQLILQRDLGHPPTEEQVERKRQQLGLDRPLPVQYVSWLGDTLRGDLGQSWATDRRVGDAIVRRLPASLMLGGTAIVLAVLIAVPVGVLSAYRRNAPVDHVSRVGALFTASFPSYFLAYVLIFAFAVRLKLVPAFGFGTVGHLLLPAVTLATGISAILVRLTRAAMLDVMGEGYIRLGRSKGLGAPRVLFIHALRNALIPVLTATTLSLAAVLNGAVIVEWIFAWPGLGKLTIESIRAKDYPLIQGVVLFNGVLYVVVNFFTDIAYGWLDPRVRVEETG
ncbi:MAG: ABC transporter permease [Actinomycetota bacterium]|nr:ABC transporter permease [Actinomycetota bacterium]